MHPCAPRGRLALLLFVACLLGATIIPGAADAKPADATRLALPHVALRIAHTAPLRIVAFGSSSTEGVGASTPDATYPKRLEAWLQSALRDKVEVVNAEIGGEDADDMARRIPAVIALHPDLVVWQTGSNDPLRDVPLERFVTRTRDGIVAFRQAGVDVMLIGPQDCTVLREHPGSSAYRDVLRQIAADMQVPLIRRYDLMHQWLAEGLVTPHQMLYGDGLHMTDGGYALLATEVGRQILALSGRAGTRAGAVLAGTPR